jgi:POT family proton-dependent oligopeptide transporter
VWNIVTAIGLVITALTFIPVVLQMRQHPKGLHVLFFAEMWERFSYYGMRGILMAYMTQHFLFADKVATRNYAAYTSLVYLLPLIGGFLADKYLGTRKAVAFGALLLVAGHCAMAIEQKPAQQELVYQGRTYDFIAEGRQDQRKVQIAVDGGQYEFGPSKDGGITIQNLPATASLPSDLPAGSYQLNVKERQPLFVTIFYLALSLIIMGVGFLKANISSIVGQLYPQGDVRRDSGFTLYYYGINLGAFWASVLCAGLGAQFGWAWGFGLAGIGMALGAIVFVRGRFLFFMPGESLLPEAVGRPPEPERLRAPVLGPLSREQVIYLLGFLGVPVVWLLLQQSQVDPEPAMEGLKGLPLAIAFVTHNPVLVLLIAGSVVSLGYVGWFMATKCTRIQAQRLALALVFFAAATVFWTLFELAGTALNQFAERNTQIPSDGFFTVNSGQTQSFNAGFILIGAPIFAALWAYLEKRGKDPNDVLKFALALMQVGAGFLVLVWGAAYADANYRVPLVFLALLYLLHTTGELMLSPVGLSAITKLAPLTVLSTMMAVWFLSSSWAQMIGGWITEQTAQDTVGGRVLDPGKALATYVEVFQRVGFISIALGVALAAASPFLKHWAHAREHESSET